VFLLSIRVLYSYNGSLISLLAEQNCEHLNVVQRSAERCFGQDHRGQDGNSPVGIYLLCSGLTYGPAATTTTATKIQIKATDTTTTVAFKDLNYDREKNNREWAVTCLIGLHLAIVSIFLSRQEKAGPVPTTVHKPLNRAILQKIQRERRADWPRAPLLALPPPLASPVVFYCGPRVFCSLTFLSPMFSYLTPPRIYISTSPRLHLPLLSRSCMFRQAPASGRCPSGGKACCSVSLSLVIGSSFRLGPGILFM
jgi:hypothetical protein